MMLTAFLRDTYGLEGTLTRLGGELDENYLFEGDFGRYIFKLMRVGCDASFIDMQVKAHQHLNSKNISVEIPEVIPCLSGDLLVKLVSGSKERLGWMISFLGGDLMANALPWTPKLTASIGTALAELDEALSDFAHDQLERKLPWDLLNAAWIKEKTHLHSDTGAPSRRTIIDTVCAQYDALFPQFAASPRTVIHNDANEMNVFVSGRPVANKMVGLIDFGDMIKSARIGEIAVAAAYAILDSDDPLANAAELLAGYNASKPLQAIEIEIFFPLVLMRLAVSVTNSAMRKIEEPNDPYLVLNEAPAWRLLERFHGVDPQLIASYFRIACGLDASETSALVLKWLSQNRGIFTPIFPSLNLNDAPKLDLSFGSATAINAPENQDTIALNASIAADMTKMGTDISIGGWGEARPIYTGKAFGNNSGDPLAPSRTHHLGVDINVPAATAVHAPLEGVVWAAADAEYHLDYGGYVILEHNLPNGVTFYSLYGHLAPNSLKHLTHGTKVQAGTQIGEIGGYEENGGWWPHLHLQLLTETPPANGTPPGACERQLWNTAKSLYPNPAPLLNINNNKTDWHEPDKSTQLQRRKKKAPLNQKLTYSDPLQVSRGWKHFLFNQQGRAYIDAYNNVPHVGHCHPHVIEAITRQMQLVSTNTRYIHESLMAYAEALTENLPAPLNKCLFTSSASEANELAIRIARKATGAKDMLVMEHGYHGITTGAMAISPYKFNQTGGDPQEDWVHVTPQPDSYRGRYQASIDVASDCAEDTQKIINTLTENGRKIAGFISECLPSVGGQLVMPEGALQKLYAAVRAAGGLCIADDVQTSLGRLGHYFWGFEYQEVIPDIIVLGKPLGNGYPLAAVITTADILDTFANGPEFFSTFGGSTVSCTAGLAVLKTIEADGLQENAHEMGLYLQAGFEKLEQKYSVIGDIRGMGLFWGIDLVLDRETRKPATTIADYIKNRLYANGILIGTDGPFDNVLKIRPPMTFDKPAADALLFRLDSIFKETAATP